MVHVVQQPCWGYYPDSKDHEANMGPTWVLSAPGGPHAGPTNLAIRASLFYGMQLSLHSVLGHIVEDWGRCVND